MISDYINLLSSDKLIIFLFHGVIEDNSNYKIRNYTSKHIKRSYFEQLLFKLKKSGVPLSMQEVISHIEKKIKFPKRSYAITFDDGFENNYSVARHILTKFETPATFYITTNFINSNSMSWIDKIEWLFETNNSFEIKLPWSKYIYLCDSVKKKKRMLEEIRLIAKQNKRLRFDDLVSFIFAQLGSHVIDSSNEDIDKKMNWDQVADLSSHELFNIGGHTHNHAIMSYLNDEELNLEIDLSLELIRQKAGLITTHYSYPEGQADHYSEKVITFLRKRGIVCSPTAIRGANDIDTSPFELKRITVI